jgi:LysM repeat protein
VAARWVKKIGEEGMTITKKDTIILAALFNIVILAGVLATAHQLAPKTDMPQREKAAAVGPRISDDKDLADRYVSQEEEAQSFDEIDQLLEDYIEEDTEETPAPKATEAKKGIKAEAKAKATKAQAAGASDEFYIVKSGDNPWKIAKKFHISFEKLLQLNHLDEAKARNLKVGSRLRIREQTP